MHILYMMKLRDEADCGHCIESVTWKCVMLFFSLSVYKIILLKSCPNPNFVIVYDLSTLHSTS